MGLLGLKEVRTRGKQRNGERAGGGVQGLVGVEGGELGVTCGILRMGGWVMSTRTQQAAVQTPAGGQDLAGGQDPAL